MVCRGVDSYLPQFTSSHGQNVVDSRGAADQFVFYRKLANSQGIFVVLYFTETDEKSKRCL